MALITADLVIRIAGTDALMGAFTTGGDVMAESAATATASIGGGGLPAQGANFGDEADYCVKFLAGKFGAEIILHAAKSKNTSHVVRDIAIETGASVWGASGVSRGTGGGVAGGALDAERWGGPGCICGVGPEIGEVVDGLRGVEDTARGGFVDELKRSSAVFTYLIPDVEACVGDVHVFGAVREIGPGGGIDLDCKGNVTI